MRGRAFAAACAAMGGLLFLAVLATVASAADVSGTWSGTCTRTYAGGTDSENAELSIDSSGGGTLTMAGSSYPVTGYVSGNSYYMHTQFGWDGVSMCDCDVDFTVSGDSMTGSGSFVNVGTTINLDFDLSRGAGFGLTITPAAATIGVIAVVTGLVGLDAALMRPPSASPSGRAPSYQPARLPAPSFTAPGLQPPEQSLGMPLQQGPTFGNHRVPSDAPCQFQGAYPPGYPYPQGTNNAMTCPFCGQPTLSPFATGWFCTNSQCPARRDWVTKGQTHHQYNSMTWRGQEPGRYDASNIQPADVQPSQIQSNYGGP